MMTTDCETKTQAMLQQEHAERRLRKSPYRGLHRVQCQVLDRTLMLRGKVSSFMLKQIAQETVRGMEGIDRIYNFLQVVSKQELLEVTDGIESVSRKG